MAYFFSFTFSRCVFLRVKQSSCFQREEAQAPQVSFSGPRNISSQQFLACP